MAAGEYESAEQEQSDKTLAVRYLEMKKKKDTLGTERWQLEAYLNSHRSGLEGYPPARDIKILKPQMPAAPESFEEKIALLKEEEAPLQPQLDALFQQMSPEGKKALMRGDYLP